MGGSQHGGALAYCLLGFEIVPPGAGYAISFDSLFRFSGFGEQMRSFVLKAIPEAERKLAKGVGDRRNGPSCGAQVMLWAEAVESEYPDFSLSRIAGTSVHYMWRYSYNLRSLYETLQRTDDVAEEMHSTA
jgi:hypothetical protein